MNKFTPGPWTVQPRCNCFIDITHEIIVKGAITMALCRVQSRDSWIDESFANARLIAAAPALYEALESMLKKYIGDDNAVIRKARAALALAGKNK